jgi:hypothetical protein
VDIDIDGNTDILSGSYSRMDSDMAGLFQVLFGTDDGTFRKATVLNGTDDEPLIIPIEDRSSITECICTRPTAVDWDSDGDLDLVVGNFAGSFYLFTGKGDGHFLPKPSKIMSGDSPLRIDGAHSDPFPVDWDGDGDLDLLSGSSQGGVQWAENSAAANSPPEMDRFQTLIQPVSRVETGRVLRDEDLTGPTSSTRVWADDVNGDGKLDVLVGDCVTLVTPAEGLSEQEFEQKYSQWQDAYTTASNELRSANADAEKRNKATQRLRSLYDQRDEFMVEERTGFVWLYVQK